nr:hypothetical protein [Tanacetum cinerariifolium]
MTGTRTAGEGETGLSTRGGYSYRLQFSKILAVIFKVTKGTKMQRKIVAEDQPYAEDASPIAQSPEYVPDGGDDGDDEEESSEDEEDDEMDVEAD